MTRLTTIIVRSNKDSSGLCGCVAILVGKVKIFAPVTQERLDFSKCPTEFRFFYSIFAAQSVGARNLRKRH
jgi:hypothetical protein